MQYDLNKELDRRRFANRVDDLLKCGAFVELTEKKLRSLNQNAYLHLLIGVVAMETGNTMEDTKRYYFKELVNPDVFVDNRTDNRGTTIKHVRSSAEVSKEEMSKCIDKFKRWAAENRIYLPEPTDEAVLRDIAFEMSRRDRYL